MDLIAAMQTEYSRCKRLQYRWALPIAVVLFLTALAGCFDLPSAVTIVLAFVVVVAQIAVFVLRQFADGHQGRAEEIRRMAMLQDGLGMKPSPVSLVRLQEIIGECVHHEPMYLQPYYDSAETAGPRRLLDITSECAYFTGGNARRAWKVIAGTAIVGLLISILGFVLAVSFASTATVNQTGAKLVLASMAFWAAGDFASMAFAFWSLEVDSESVLKSCDQALSASDTGGQQQSALSLFAEYNCAVVKAPPIPAFIYRRSQARMNDAWRNRRGISVSQPNTAAQHS